MITKHEYLLDSLLYKEIDSCRTEQTNKTLNWTEYTVPHKDHILVYAITLDWPIYLQLL